ncbi:Sulfate/thiosulfate import ATP-binding protein CysA [Sporotomaculum syntrophicum]|uniref:Sulfate/thiosulfate import ATP-binding protein CysA n=1 Tax=Sporotomaculum syntrophicum TaxID=182264 RepID=A0A9D2WP29_9FIRM|nr:ABC transporter ATP-binding protein [Sporotomaculum syntrophicum]KAF1084301.1 Sulfate/thiosulfate import ATP-binding protein CysA [Sporotomaculum syntrophicum]
MFKLENVTLSFDNLKVLTDFNLASQGHEFISILGPSGVGKTCILNILAGLLKPQAGLVSVTSLRTGYVFQEPRLIPWCTVEENMTLGLYGLKITKAERTARINKLLDKLSLNNFARYYPGQLSGGMKQRVALGRAFAVEPDLLLMDEPFSSLDENLRQAMRELLKSLIQWNPCATVFVTHDVREAIQLADRIIVLKGRPCQIVREINVDAGQSGEESYQKNLAEIILQESL